MILTFEEEVTLIIRIYGLICACIFGFSLGNRLAHKYINTQPKYSKGNRYAA